MFLNDVNQYFFPWIFDVSFQCEESSTYIQTWKKSQSCIQYEVVILI